MQLAARGAQKTRNESKKLQMYSKQWLPGDQLRVFYPIFWQDGRPEIAVGAIWGHNVSDIKELGLKTAFIPSTTDFDENAMPVGQPDITYQFSQIARVFVNGMHKLEEEAVQKKSWPTEAARKEALKAVEDKYDTKNNRNAVRPIIGKAQFYISTEVLSIKLVNGSPQMDSIALTSAPLSNQTINKLYDIMEDPKYAPEPNAEFLEVEWKYPAGSDKGESGRSASPAGITAEFRLGAQFPEAYSSVIGQSAMVARDSESIVRRATRSIDPNKVKQALTRYSFMKSEYLDVAVEEDEETLLKHADLIKDLDLVRALTPNTALVEKIEAAIREMEAATPVATPQTDVPNPLNNLSTPEIPSVAPETPPVTTPEVSVPDLTINPEAPNLSMLLNNANNAGAGDISDEVDFSADMV